MKRILMRTWKVAPILGLLVAPALLFGVAGPAAAAAVQAAPPSTQPVIPLTARGCGGDVCMYLSTPSGGYVYVQAWAYDVGFHGHFHLVGPDGITQNSPAGTWPAGGTRYTFYTVPAIVGTYCVTGWSGTIDEGTACEALG